MNDAEESAYVADALIVAPHQDDETLGCGGTIVRKLRAGAKISALFVTDGATSHAHLMQRRELATLRRSEAVAACARLGIAADRVHFLDYRDGELAFSMVDASRAIAEVLERTRPEQVFIPHQGDGLSDHEASARAARVAAALIGVRPTWWEYPIWLWDRWPWTNPFAFPRSRRGRRDLLRTVLHPGVGFRMKKLLNVRVDVADDLPAKAAALAEHRTQMTRYDERADWLTLGDIDGGAWLANFARRYEFFRISQSAVAGSKQ